MTEFLAAHTPGVAHWLVLSAILFSIGLYGVLTRRNAVGILMGVELMLNSAALNFVVFNYFVMPGTVDGHIMAIFVIAVAAAEVVVGMAIFVALFRHRGTVDVTRMDLIRDAAPAVDPFPTPASLRATVAVAPASGPEPEAASLPEIRTASASGNGARGRKRRKPSRRGRKHPSAHE